MDLGKDIVQKIRSAVKSKLMDLGSYVDDELPDYVMVMVANKKSESQMREDLSLFLGAKTSKFTSWLHNLLDKLNSISADCSVKDKIVSMTKSSGKTSQSKYSSESRSPNHRRESKGASAAAKVATSEVFVTEISLKSDWDDIDREDDEDVIIGTPKKSSEAAASSRPLRKRSYWSSEKKQQKKSHQVKSVNEEEVQDKGNTHTQSTNHMPPVKPVQPIQRAAATLVTNENPAVNLPQQQQIPQIETIKSDISTTKSAATFPPSDCDDHFYPYEISGDVEMISQDELSPEKNVVAIPTMPRPDSNEMLKRVEGGCTEIKSRKIFVSGRGLGPKSERKVALVNPEEDVLSSLAPPSMPSQPMAGPVSEITNFIVTLNGAYAHLGDRIFDCENYDIEEEEGFSDSSDQSKVGWSPAANYTHVMSSKPLVICDNGDDEEEDEMEDNDDDDDDRPFKRQKVMERCRYWPKCMAGRECTYHHPYRPCKTFPNCFYKEKCLFLHPACKFDSSCTNLACPFVHTSPRAFITAPPTVILQPIRVRRASTHKPQKQPLKPRPSKVQCRFFPSCVNMDCPYSHPKPCRYGLSCNQKNKCTFSHPTLPSKDKLKWCAKIIEDVPMVDRSMTHL